MSVFKRKPLPPAMTRQDWIDRHELWGAERTLLDMPLFADFKRSPVIERHDGGWRVWLPPWQYMSASVKAQIVGAVASRLGIDEPAAAWRTKGAEPSVTIRPRPQVPQKVLWSEVAELVSAASPTRPLAGLGANGTPVFVDYEADSPHIAISGGSGAGKSVLCASLLAQGLHHGALAVILDVKRHSLRAMFGLPGVHYCRDIEDVHAALIATGEEVHRRNVAADDPTAPAPTRLLVVAEEINLMTLQLGWFWEQTRAKADPKTSPAITALRAILFTGRAVGVNLLAIGQQLTARATGGGEARESMGARFLARATDNTWKMLCPQIGNPPARSRVPGRWHLVVGDDVTELQVPFADDSEARRWALAGRRPMSELVMTTAPVVAEQVSHVSAETLVGLREALPLLPGPEMSLAALRKAANRGGRFPSPLGFEGGQNVYSLDELTRWKCGRDTARAIQSVGDGGRLVGEQAS